MSTPQSPDIGEVAYETLTNLHSDQSRRVVGYFKSQSLRHLLRDLAVDDEDLIRVEGSRRVNETAHEIPFFGYADIRPYVEPIETRRETVHVEFDKATDGEFSRDQILGWLDEDQNEEIHDIPVETIVFKFESDLLHEHLWEFIQETLESHYDSRLADPGEFQQPFYAVMEASGAGHRRVRREVRDYHEERYFLPGDSTDADGDRGLGQKLRTMDLTGIWSHRAFTNSGNTIATQDGDPVTIRDVEDWVVNHVSEDAPEYGAINSMLLVNYFRDAFHKGIDTKRFDWREQDGWVQVG